MKKIISVALAFIIAALGFIVPVSAVNESSTARVITDDGERSSLLTDFNGNVNRIKTDKPACRVTTSYDIAEPSVRAQDGKPLDENEKKWIKWIVDACFKDGAGLANTLFSTIFKDTSVPQTMEFAAGEIRNNRLPVSGKEYVSALSDDDKFVMTVQKTGGTKLHPEQELTYTRIAFTDVALDDASASPLGKIFNLTDGELNPIVVDNYTPPAGTGETNALEGVKFDMFTFSNASATAVTNYKGDIVAYSTRIDYNFSLSLYDFIRLVSVTAGFDFMSVAVAIANTIIVNTNKGTISAEDTLRQRRIEVVYTITLDVTDFSWDARCFGDIASKAEKDEGVSVTDARYALRYAIGIQDIRDQTALMYADVDFDGVVTVSDARLILRMAIGLEEKFSEVPEGKEIKIVEVKEPEIPEEEKTPSGGDDPGSDNPGTDNPGSGMIDLSPEVTDLVQSIFDVINSIKGIEGGAAGALEDLILYLQNIGKK